MAFSICSDASLLHCTDQDQSVQTHQNGPELARCIAAKINNVLQQQWPSLFFPRHVVYNSAQQSQCFSQDAMHSMWDVAQQLQEQLSSLPKRTQQPLFHQFMQFNQHIQMTCLSIKKLTQCIQAESMPLHTRRQLIYDIVRAAKQWIFRISDHYRQITKDRWNIFIMFNSITNLPEVHVAFAPQQLLSMTSRPDHIIYFLSLLYLIMKFGYNSNPKTFMPSEEMFQTFTKKYSPDPKIIHYPQKNPFEIHTPLMNCIYVMIFSYIHNFGIEQGLKLCNHMLSQWKGRLIQHMNPFTKDYSQNYIPTLRDLFVFIRYDKTIPISPWIFDSKRRFSLATTLRHLILENSTAKIFAQIKMHSNCFMNDSTIPHEASLDQNSIQLMEKLHKNAQEVAQKCHNVKIDTTSSYNYIIKAMYEAILVGEDVCYATKVDSLRSYTETSLHNTRQQLYTDHFYHEVYGCMKFELMLDLHDWNMQSAQNTTLEMQCHNKQQLCHFRSETSKRIILGLHNTKMNFAELQTNIYAHYLQAKCTTHIIVIGNELKNYLTMLITSNITPEISSLNSMLEECLCSLKSLLDKMDPNKSISTVELFDNLFSADHHTHSTFDSWYPSKEQHTCQQCLVECPV